MNSDDKEKMIQHESILAALNYYHLDPQQEYHIVLTAQPLASEEEQTQYVSKFLVLVEQQSPVVVYGSRATPTVYQVQEENENSDEETEQEAYYILMQAVRYLEKDIEQVQRVEVQDQVLGEDTPYSASWKVVLDGEACIVVRSEDWRGEPIYHVLC